MENLIHHKHSLKILFKSKHFPGRYRRKREWVFFSETQRSTINQFTEIHQKHNNTLDGDQSNVCIIFSSIHPKLFSRSFLFIPEVG